MSNTGQVSMKGEEGIPLSIKFKGLVMQLWE
jgi:hypothetical protein